MKRKLFLLGLILLVGGMSFNSFAWSQDEQAKIVRVVNIQIKGNNAISTATILNKIKMRKGDIFEKSALNNELKRLYAMGYFSDVFVETEEKPEGIIVVFSVIEKPIIADIEFKGNSRINKLKLEKKLVVKKGTLLDYHLLSQDVSEIKNFYMEEGYSRVKVDYKIESGEDKSKVTVVFLIDEGYALKIKTITFEGNEHIPANELKRYMATKPVFFFFQKGAFDEDEFQADLDRISAAYRSKGFLDAKMSSRADYSEDKKEVNLIVVVEEGKEYLIGEIKIKGELFFPEEDVWKRINIKTGDAFDYAKIKEDVESIRTFYYDKGYMNAEINLYHAYNAGKDKMDLVFDIKANDETYVGKVNIIGNTKTRDKVIRREVRAYPGEKYNGEQLRLSKERIYNLGFFEDVYLETVPTKEANVKNLNVTVKETKTGDFSFGGGYSSVDAFIGFVQVKQRNFDILNFPTFTGSGQDLTIRAEAGSAKTNYYVSWTDPWIFDYPYLFGFDLYREEHRRYGMSGYDYGERRTGSSLRLGKDITDYLSTGLIYNLEEVKISDLPDDVSNDLKDERGENMLSRITWKLKYDTRDNKFSPSKGILTGGFVENAGGFIGGSRDFVKCYAYTSFYHSLIKDIVLELAGRGGVVQNYANTEKVPIYERFYAGGATTIRGYKERGVGPRDSFDKNIVVGGKALLLGNAEVTFPIFKRLIKGAVFYDVGSVSNQFSEMFKDTQYKQGVGVGVRVKTPIGPVKLDYGYPLNENEGDKKEGQFYFSVSHGF
ncbi:MAG: outer membrane protein assembly factor BamA [Candidatus Omnitrophota bacterium]